MIKGLSKVNIMKKFIFSIIFVLLLFPTTNIYSQEYTDTNPTLTVSQNSGINFVYQDSDGYTVVIGLIENNDPLAFVTDVSIRANFYDDFNSNPLEVNDGSTTLKVIPPNSKSPFMIRSETSNSAITEVSTKILNFGTSKIMKDSLKISINDVSLEPITTTSDPSYTLSFSGILQNEDASIFDTSVHFAFYDVFSRIIQISTIEIGEVSANELISLKLNEEINSSSVGFLLFAESDEFYYDFTNVKIPTPQIRTNLVTISDVAAEDTLGRPLSEIKIGDFVKIQSETIMDNEKAGKWEQTPFTYYVQIKESSSNSDIPPTIEYIGKYDGKFLGNGVKLQSVNWIPEREGLFFIETFVWDENNVPLAEQGPFVLILVK